jgi:hypothetical protein
MDNAALLTAAKWVGGLVAVVLISIVLYLGAVLSVYILGWVLELIGIIFE